MKLIAASSITTLVCASTANAQSYSHNYESFFGKDDRIELYSEAANERFEPHILETIRKNTLLMDCGSQGKPSTAFIVENQIVSAAHNLTLAQVNKRDCKIGRAKLPQGQASIDFKDNGTINDAAYDIATWPNITAHQGFKICETIETDSQYALVQSLDGTGRLGISPFCKITSVADNLISTTCKGHYKASGAPLLAVSENDVCVAGVFNAHSGKLFGYESYAAKLTR